MQLNLTQPALLEWLKTQPSDKVFEYFDHRECLVAQFVKSQFPEKEFNNDNLWVGGTYLKFYGEEIQLSDWLYSFAMIGTDYTVGHMIKVLNELGDIEFNYAMGHEIFINE